MEEDTNEIAQEEAKISGEGVDGGVEPSKDFSGRLAGALIGLAVGLFVASSMTLLTSFWFVWFWAIVPVVLIPIGWWVGRRLPKVSRLSVFLLVVLCPVVVAGPIKIQHMRFSKIVDQISTFPSAELQELQFYLFVTDSYPGFSVAFTTDADVRDVVEFYRDSLSKSGWNMEEVSFDDERSLAAAEFVLLGQYRLSLRMKKGEFWFRLSEKNFVYDLPKRNLEREMKHLN